MFYKLIIALCLSILSFSVGAQEYCLKFSKENKKDVFIEKGKRLSYVLRGEARWKEGVVIKIGKDSLFFEVEKESKLFNDSENNELIIPLKEIEMIAYPKAATILRGTGLIAGLVVATALTAGAFILGTDFEANDSTPPLKVFKREVDIEDGWRIDVVICE